MKIERILCPTDFSDSSERTLAFAIDLISDHGGRIDVLHVFEHPSYIKPPGQPHTEEGARRYFERLHGDLYAPPQTPEEAHVEVGFDTCQGVADEEIIARSAGYDLIVMATHSRTGMSRVFFGSVVSSVLTGARCPVLTLPGDLDLRG